MDSKLQVLDVDDKEIAGTVKMCDLTLTIDADFYLPS